MENVMTEHMHIATDLISILCLNENVFVKRIYFSLNICNKWSNIEYHQADQMYLLRTRIKKKHTSNSLNALLTTTTDDPH